MTPFPIPNLSELAKILPGLLYPHQPDGEAFPLSTKSMVLTANKDRESVIEILPVAEIRTLSNSCLDIPTSGRMTIQHQLDADG